MRRSRSSVGAPTLSRRRGRPPGPLAAELMTSIAAACATLEVLAARGEPASLTELALATGRPKSSTLRLLASLARGGLLARDPDGRFQPGPLVTRLGALRHSRDDLARRLRGELERLARETRESASFSVRDGDERLLLVRVASPEPVRHHLEEGARLPLDGGAPGEILLAFGDESPRGRLAEVRARGWAASFGARDPHVAAVAVPVFGPHARLLGALALSGPVTRVTEDRLPSLLTVLRSAVRRLAPVLER